MIASLVAIFIINRVQQPEEPCPAQQQATCKTEQSPSVIAEQRTAAYTADLAEVSAVLVLATAILAVFTYGLWSETERLANEARESAEKNAAKMQATVDESKRSADEMAKIALAVGESGRAATNSVQLISAQSRAYVGALIGGAVYQERGRNLKFEAIPILMNIGHTPARKVTHRMAADILPIPIPENFGYPLPTTTPESDIVLWPQQRYDMHALVRDFVDELDVPAIKVADGRALCVWGTITYEDTAGASHYTNFCHIMTWRGNDTVYGLATFKHNDAD